MPDKDTISAAIDELAPRLKELALEIHANPELGMQEHKAAKLLSGALDEQGFDVTRGVAGMETAFTAAAGTGAVTAALMLEYDALPKLGHACGHNLNGTAALGAALGLKRVIDAVDGRVIAFGTPGEETYGGKVHIINAGLLDGVDFAMMAHTSRSNSGSGSHIAVRRFKVMFHGTSAHAAASPDEGVNALDAMILLFNGVALMRQQLRTDSRVHGIIAKGGDAPNIIPDYTEAGFYLRHPTEEYLDVIEERFRKIAAGAAAQTGARVEIEPGMLPYRANVTNEALNRAYCANAEALGVTLTESALSKGSTDMGNVSREVPSIHSSFKIGDGPDLACHSVKFREAAKSEMGLASMVTTAKVLALTAYDVITDGELLREMKKEFDETFLHHTKKE